MADGNEREKAPNTKNERATLFAITFGINLTASQIFPIFKNYIYKIFL